MAASTTTLTLLVSGSMAVRCVPWAGQYQEAFLVQRDDYVISPPGFQHYLEVWEDSVVLSISW